MARTLAGARAPDESHGVHATEPSRDAARASGDRVSGMQDATHSHEPSAERISGFDPMPTAVPVACSTSRSRAWSEVSPSGSGDVAEPDPCAEIPIMRELGLQRGTMIADTYRIVRPLGAGGMGVKTSGSAS